jgi:hypothetical protein
MTVADRLSLTRASLTQVEFFKLCQTLQADPAIRNGDLNFDQVVHRYHSTVFPGRLLKPQNIRKALKATDLNKYVKPSANFRAGTGNIQKLLWTRQKNLELVVRRIATQLGVPHTELDTPIKVEDLENTQIV